ncbi:Peptidase C48 domain containing protein [Trichuris trichiura]|uniref:Peptidase C48 domain containing protein n=1 Tax=Trichuris trichiura TaxID=36087 RepID=A0A077Z9D3_TRITR|nr:Peptidase C48 domain containing protein [Trichuris trichiura]
MSEIVLTFHDVVLRQWDIALLKPNKWLNDNILAFFMEYFAEEMFAEQKQRIAFVDPSLAHLLKMADKRDLRTFPQLLGWNEKELLIIPVNDCMSAEGGGGHWSLLVYRRSEKKFECYDSMPMNRLVGKSINLLTRKLTSILEENVSEDSEDPILDVLTCAQQTNSSDCGVYVVIFAQLVAKDFCHRNPQFYNDLLSLDQNDIEQMRVQMLDIIASLKEKMNASKS